MRKVLVMDDEPLSLQRILNVLCDAHLYDLSTAGNLPAAVKVVERMGASLDVLVIDVSMFETMAVELLDLFADACPKAKILVITPRLRRSIAVHPQLRKPFSDENLLRAVCEVLEMRHGVVVELAAAPEPQRLFRRRCSSSPGSGFGSAVISRRHTR